MPADSPPRLRADAERNRHLIVDAARRTFAEHGVDVGVDAIARAAGVGVGTVYRRFPTKTDLLRAIAHDQIDLFVERLRQLEAIEDPWDAFAAAAGAFAETIASDRGFFELSYRTDCPIADEGDRKRVRDALEPFLHRGQAAGVVRDDIVVVDIPALCYVAARLPPWRLEREPDLWRRYLGIVLDGVRAVGAHPLEHPAPAPIGERAARS